MSASAQADDLQELAEKDWDNADVPSLHGLNDLESDFFFSHSELNENIFHTPPNDLVHLNKFGDCNENYVLSRGDETTVENPPKEQNFSPAANIAFQAYELKLEPVSISKNHPNVDQYPNSGSDISPFDFQVSELVNSKAAPGHAEQPQESFYSGEDKKSTHKCDICDFTSPKPYLLARHVKSHFDNSFNGEPSLKKRSLKQKCHACNLCSSKFASPTELSRHVKYKHTHEKNFKCELCDYAAVEKVKVKRHMLFCHTGERPHQCNDCSKAFPTFFNLKRHIRTHTMEKPYNCDICSATFAQLNALKGHRKTHTANKPAFQCDVCPSTFGRKADLRKHYKQTHISDTPIHCEKCGKVFKDPYSFKLHKNEHKIFSCSLCTFSCTSSKYFKKHSNSHMDLEPLKCDLCDKCFYEKGRLKNHQILAHTEFKPLKKPKYKRKGPRVKCDHCIKTFSSEGNLQRHLRMIHMPTDSDEEELKRETALKLDKVIDEMLGRKTNDNTLENDHVLNSDDTSEVFNSDEIIAEEVVNPVTDHMRSLAEVTVFKTVNHVMEFDFDSDDESSEEVNVHVKNDADKSKDLETCFGFNEYF